MERIPEEVLKAARLKTKRRIAAVLVDAIAESGLEIIEIEARLSARPINVMGFINSLIDGSENSLDGMSDIATALGVEMRFGVTPAQQVIDEYAETEN